MKPKKLKMQHEQFGYQYWINEAIKFVGAGLVPAQNNEIPVSALIIKDNKLISKGTNKTESTFDSTAHAEIIAIREASKSLNNWRLDDCTLYVTLEPCSMCVGAIINSRISTVVFGAYDLNYGACGSKINLIYELGKHKEIEVIGGILEKETSKLLRDFFEIRR